MQQRDKVTCFVYLYTKQFVRVNNFMKTGSIGVTTLFPEIPIRLSCINIALIYLTRSDERLSSGVRVHFFDLSRCCTMMQHGPETRKLR